MSSPIVPIENRFSRSNRFRVHNAQTLSKYSYTKFDVRFRTIFCFSFIHTSVGSFDFVLDFIWNLNCVRSIFVVLFFLEQDTTIIMPVSTLMKIFKLNREITTEQNTNTRFHKKIIIKKLNCKKKILERLQILYVRHIRRQSDYVYIYNIL